MNIGKSNGLKHFSRLLGLLAFFTFSHNAFGNDGRDRSRLATPTLFQLFPEALGWESGYRFLEKDGPGGADGTEMFRWARPVGVSLVRIAAYEATKQFGKAAFPMAIFDLTSENGDTPVEMKMKQPPRGRHPGGSHDGGLNMDLGYYLTSDKGRDFTPDLAACSDHFRAAKDGSKALEDAGQCLGAADRLSVDHQAYFLLEIAKINRGEFRGDLIEEIGVDWKVRERLISTLETWVKSQRYGATRELLEDLSHAFTSDEWDGWATSHLHHIHLRMRDIAMLGINRKAFDALQEREKKIDQLLLRQQNKTSDSVLRVRLLSSGLSRSIDAEVLGGQPSDKFHVSFQSDAMERVAPDPSRAPRISATWDLPNGFSDERSVASVKAEIQQDKGRSLKLATEQPLPQKPNYLSIAVDPSQIRGRIERASNAQRLTVRLDFPQPYAAYITKVGYRISLSNQDPAETTADETKGDDFAYSLPLEAGNAIQNITAIVTLSSRMKVEIPVYNLPTWSTKL